MNAVVEFSPFSALSRWLLVLLRDGDILGEDLKAVRAIGQEAHAMGGLDAMYETFNGASRPFVRHAFGDPRGVWIMQLMDAWEGIGGWRH
jgi:hypothetical protein